MASQLSLDDLAPKPSMVPQKEPEPGGLSLDDIAPKKPEALSLADIAPKKPVDTSGPMPGIMEAGLQGVKHAISDVGQSAEVVQGQQPTQGSSEESPAAGGFEWRDLYEPSRGAAKVAYQTGASSPTIAGGVLGGLGGSLAGPVGTAVGGAGGAATGAALQSIGPAFARELKKAPSDPEGAWDRAVQSSVVSGVASGASWALFPAKFINGPIKNLAFQAFLVQPPINVAEKAAQNVVTGDPATQDLGQAYASGVVGTAVPAIGHAALRGRFGEPDTKSNIPTPAESTAKAAELRQQSQDLMFQVYKPGIQHHVAEKLQDRADYLKTAADYEEDRYQAPAFADQKFKQAETLKAQSAAATDPAMAQMYKDMAAELTRSGNHDLFIAALPPPLPKYTGFSGRIVKNYLDNIDPGMASEHATKAETVIAQYKSKQNYIENSLKHLGDTTYHYEWNKVPWDDQMKFLSAYQQGLPVPHDLQTKYPWTVAADAEYRKQFLEDFHEEKDMGSKAYFLKNYMAQMWQDPVRAERLFDPQNITNTMGDIWFQKARSYEMYELGIANGLEPKYKNIQDIVTARRIAGADMINKMEMLQNLQKIGLAIPHEQAPAHIKNPNIVGAPYEWQPINAPDRQQWLIAPDAQTLWKNGVESKGLWADPGKMGDTYRGWMAAKNYWVPLKLAVSAFHFVHVAHINAVNNMSRAVTETFGHPFSGQQSLYDRAKAIPEAMLQAVGDPFFRAMPYIPFKGKQAMKAWDTAKELQTPQQAWYTQLANEGGISFHQSDQLRMKGERQFWDAFGKNKYLAAAFYSEGTLLPGPGLAYKKTMGAMFDKWIPSLKAAAYTREAEALFRRRPDLIADDTNRKVALRAIGKQIDSRFGEMFYGSLFWNRTLKDASIGSFLSLGWNLGFMREFGGGAFEPIVRRMIDAPNPTRKLIRETTNKTTNMFLYGLTAATINGMLNYMLAGDMPSGYDYIFPRIGGLNPDGSPRRVTNAFYTREIPMAMKHIEAAGGGLEGTAMGLMEMMYNKMMFQPVVELIRNKDYFGYSLRDERSPAYQQIAQMGSHLLNSQLEPMSIVGAKRALELSGKPHDTASVLQQLGDRDVYMPLLGFGPAPAYASKDEWDNRIESTFKQTVIPERKSFEVSANSKARSEARTAYIGAQQRHDQAGIQAAANRMAALGMKSKEINKIQPGGSTDYMFGRLQGLDQASMLKEMPKDKFKRFYPLSSYAPKGGKPPRHFDPEVTALVRKYYAQP